MFDAGLSEIAAIQVLGLHAALHEVQDEYVKCLEAKALVPVLEEKIRILEGRIKFYESLPDWARPEEIPVPAWAQ